MRSRRIRRYLLAAAALALSLPLTVTPAASASPSPHGHGADRPRIIVSQDGEVDDMDSFIRFLYYANEFDIEGIVYSSSRFHYAGDGATVPPYRWTGTEWVHHYLDLYAEIYPNLRRHAPGYPSPEQLRALYKIGNIDNVGEMDKDTEGSDWIRKVILEDKPGPLYIQSWGGLNTTARALRSIQDQYEGTRRWPAIQREISHKVVIYNILNQDATLDGYIRPNWPDLKVVDNQSQFWSFAYLWTRQVPAAYQPALQAPYLEQNFLTGHGSLLQEYRTYRDGNPTPGDDENNRWRPEENLDHAVHDFISEGDSPSFLYLLDFNGLRSSEDPTYGGWGGRFALNPSSAGWIDTTDVNTFTGEPDRAFPQTRWVADLQNDFAARADWGATPHYRDANHNPRASVREGLDLKEKAGRTVTLHGRGADPDGDRLTYRWWQYTDADTYPGVVTLTGADTPTTTFTVPADARHGDTIHLILEVTDDGTPALKHYQRVIVTVK